jgi:hypothetical protein
MCVASDASKLISHIQTIPIKGEQQPEQLLQAAAQAIPLSAILSSHKLHDLPVWSVALLLCALKGLFHRFHRIRSFFVISFL